MYYKGIWNKKPKGFIEILNDEKQYLLEFVFFTLFCQKK